MKVNNVYNLNCLDGMKLLEDEIIDLTVTLPPYDDIRNYKGYEFDFESIAKELYRITKQGGVVVWSNKGDLVFDPFMGIGTIEKMAILNDRKWLGFEISEEYCEMIKNRRNRK